MSISFGMYLQTKCSMLGPLFQSSLNKTCMFLCKTEKGNFGFAIIYEMFTINFIQNVLYILYLLMEEDDTFSRYLLNGNPNIPYI